MIEVATSPKVLSTWKSEDQAFYLELYGETSPVVDRSYALVGLGGSSDGGGSSQQDASDGGGNGSNGNGGAPTPAGPIYQYWWTIGHSAAPGDIQHFWSRLQNEVAARVYLFFPLSGGWRIKELVATVNYLHPFREHTTWWSTFADDWKNIVSPTIADAGSLAGLVPNPAFSGASALLGTIAKLQITSVPQVGDFAWSVGKTTTHLEDAGVMQGVEWTLPKRMFTDLGNRLTGSIALSFIPAPMQQEGEVLRGDPPLKKLPLRAHAVVYHPDGQDKNVWVPGGYDFVKLQLAPRFGDAGKGK